MKTYLSWTLMVLTLFTLGRERAEGRTFTLSEAISYALLHNHDLLAKDQDIGSKEAAVGEKLALSRPKLSFSFQQARVSRVASFVGRRTRSKTSQNGKLSLLYPLYQFGRDDIEVAVARREVSVEQLERAKLERDVTFDVKKAFYQTYLSQQLLNLAEQEVKRAEDFLKNTEKKVEAGLLPNLEKTRAEVDLKGKEKNLESARHDLESSLAALKHKMGYPLTSPLSIELTLKKPSLPDLSREKCVAQSLELRPELKRLELEKKNNQDGIALAKRAPLPQTSLFSNYLLQKGSVFQPETSIEVGFLFQADIFDGGASRATIAELKRDSKALDNRIANVKEEVALEVGLRILDLQEAFTQYQLSVKERTLAEQLLSVQKARFESGFGIVLEMLDAENRFLQARIGEEQAMTKFYLAEEALEKAAGGPCWK